MIDLRHKLDELAPERIRDELFKSAKYGGGALASYIEHLDDTGLLGRFLPELVALQGLEHKEEHHPEGGVWEHVLAAVRASDSHDPVHNLAILFHDVGKAVTRGYHDDGGVHYQGHERAGGPIFNKLARRLKFSNEERQAIKTAVVDHMKMHKLHQMRDKKVLALRQHPHWDVLHTVGRADAKARLHLWNPEEFNRRIAHADALFQRMGDSAEFERRMAELIDGRKIIALTGAKGPEIGRIKKIVRDWIIDNDFNVSAEEVEEKVLSLA